MTHINKIQIMQNKFFRIIFGKKNMIPNMAKIHATPVQESHKLTNIATIDHFIEQSLSCCDHVIITMKKHDAKYGKTTYSACARKPQTD